MDKVQFNTQIVLMRKTVKRAKVQLVRRLTRQIAVINKKKGSEKQIAQNERRAGRLVKEIEVIKDLPPDEVTISAIIAKESLEEVLNKPNSTADERGLARLIHHKLIVQQLATFKDLVTDDLLAVGKKKEKSMERIQNPEQKTSEASDVSEESESDDDERENDEDSLIESGKNSVKGIRNSAEETRRGKSQKLKSTNAVSLSGQKKQLEKHTRARHKRKEESDFFVTGSDGEDANVSGEISDNDGSSESDSNASDAEDDYGVDDVDDDLDDDDHDNMEADFGAELRELSDHVHKQQSRHADKSAANERKRSKGLDSLFVGKLSGKSPLDAAASVNRSGRNRPGQKERHRINIKKQLQVLRRPSAHQPQSRHVALVDMPSLATRDKAVKKVITGINAMPEKPKIEPTGEKRLPPSQRPLDHPKAKRGRERDGGGGGRGQAGGKGASKAPGQKAESLHPSWEAKRRKKEQESKILPFQGKKITFDD
ncbi:uncharacterized protein [Diadema antillarum]|uniref:uncharacterized protein n=1 Tax=Diadema antillarum TaxID=105358 RepID=UPI003A83E642